MKILTMQSVEDFKSTSISSASLPAAITPTSTSDTGVGATIYATASFVNFSHCNRKKGSEGHYDTESSLEQQVCKSDAITFVV